MANSPGPGSSVAGSVTSSHISASDLGTRSPTTSAWRISAVWDVVRELTYLVILAALYELIRANVVQSGAIANRHGLWVVDVEQSLGIFRERSVQEVFVSWHWVIRGMNLYYGGTHFLVPIAVLVWLAVRHPAEYFRARTILAVTTAIAFVCFWLFPVAPPRLLPLHFGFVDTIRHLGGAQVQNAMMDRAGNAYAALPSLHMAWAVWVPIAIYPLLRHRWSRVVAIVYPIFTGLVVVVTGNHFILDALTGTLLVLAVAWALDRIRARRTPVDDGPATIDLTDRRPQLVADERPGERDVVA